MAIGYDMFSRETLVKETLDLYLSGRTLDAVDECSETCMQAAFVAEIAVRIAIALGHDEALRFVEMFRRKEDLE